MPTTWTDPLNVTWRPRLTLGIVRRFELLTGCGLLAPSGWESLAAHAGHVATLAWLTCEAQANELKVSQEAFEDRLVLGDAVPVLLELLADFFRRQKLGSAQSQTANGAAGPGATSTGSPPSPQ